MNLNSFIEECKRRKVISSISIYALSAWILIQVAATTFPYLGFPKIATTAIIIIVLILFPVVILFSWFYNVVPDPDSSTEHIYDDDSEAKHYRKRGRWAIIIISSLVGILVAIFIVRLVTHQEGGKVIEGLSLENIAVLEFENFTKHEDFELVGRMASDWISHGIVQHQVGSVIEYETLRNYQDISDFKGGILDIPGVSKLLDANLQVVKGSFYLKDEHLIFQCRIMDGEDPVKSYGFENVVVEVGEKLKGIDLVTQQVLGYLSSRKDKELMSIPRVPKYDSYQYYLNAKDVWRSDYAYSEELLRKAIELSPNFKQASNLLMRVLYNTKQYSELDSLISNISKSKTLGMDSELVLFMKSLLSGENGKAYTAHSALVEENPADLNLNIESMVTAMEFVNKPADAISIHDRIRDDNFSLDDCSYCLIRDEILARAYIAEGRHKAAARLLSRLSEHSKRRQTIELLVKAYVLGNNVRGLDRILKKSRKMNLDLDWRYLYYAASREFHLLNDSSNGLKYGTIAITEYEKKGGSEKMLGRLQYMCDNLETARGYFQKIIERKPHDTYSISKLAQINYKLGNKDLASEYLDSMDEFLAPYRFGAIHYQKAQALANMDRTDEAFSELLRSVAEGKRFQLSDFRNDTDLLGLHKNVRFEEEVMKYWH